MNIVHFSLPLPVAERIRDLLMGCGRAGDFTRVDNQMPTKLAPFYKPVLGREDTGFDPDAFRLVGRAKVERKQKPHTRRAKGEGPTPRRVKRDKLIEDWRRKAKVGA